MGSPDVRFVWALEHDALHWGTPAELLAMPLALCVNRFVFFPNETGVTADAARFVAAFVDRQDFRSDRHEPPDDAREPARPALEMEAVAARVVDDERGAPGRAMATNGLPGPAQPGPGPRGPCTRGRCRG